MKRFPKSKNVGLVPLVLPTETALTEAESVQRWNEQACCQRNVVVTGLVGTFPASDPVSITQPSPSKHDSHQNEGLSVWQKIVAMFS
jgi:hypothetical protein